MLLLVQNLVLLFVILLVQWLTVKAKAVECLGKTPFGKAKSLIALVPFMGG